MSIPRYVTRFILRHRMLLFLSFILLLFIIFPLIHEQYAHYLFVLEVIFSFLMIGGLFIVSDNEKILTIAVLVAILAFTVIWFNFFLQSQSLALVGLILEITFFMMTTIMIIHHVLSYKKVTADKIYGAICGYFLIGIITTLVYITIEIAEPGAFSIPFIEISDYNLTNTHRIYFLNFLYYSFVTQTTLGYGDLVPLSNFARMISTLQAVIGQLYVAVLIARLVGLHISHSHLLDRGPSK